MPARCIRRFEEFQSLAHEIGFDQGKAGDVTARPRETGDYSCCDGVNGSHEHNRDRPRGILGRHDRWRPRCDNYIDIAVDQFGCRIGKLVRVVRQPVFDADVLALDVPELTQPLPKAAHEGLEGRAVA